MTFRSDRNPTKPGKRGSYVPVVGILLSTVILVIVLVIFSFRSIHRQGNLVERFLRREGIALMNSLEAAVRVGFRLDPKEGQFQVLVEELARQKDILYVTILDKDGRVLAHSDSDEIGRLMPLGDETSDPEKISDRLLNHDGKYIYEIRKAFLPRGSPVELGNFPKGGAAGVIPPLPADRLWMVFGLNPEDYMNATREDRVHAILMAAILFVVGGASLYFVFLVQHYTTVDRTLRRMQGYVRRVLESLQEGVVTLDASGRLTTVNRAGADLLGGTQEQLRGMNHGDLFMNRRDQEPVSLKELSAVRNQEFRLRRLDERSIPVSVTGSHLLESTDEERGIVLLFRDLREVQRLQAEANRNERLAAIGRLAAGVAHEVRNPLSSIKGFAQFFRSKFQSDSDERGYAETIVKEVDRLNRMVTELLDYAKPLEPRLKEADLASVVDQALDLVRNDARRRGIRIRRDAPESRIFHRIDSDKIIHALLNVLLNAIEAMGEGGCLSVRIEGTGEGGVDLSISDTGPGVPRENLPRLLDPFFTTKPSGTGLGLSIVHRIVESHHGELQFDSRPDEGTTVRIHLPRARDNSSNAGA